MMLIQVIVVMILKLIQIECYGIPVNLDTLYSAHIIMRHAARAPSLSELSLYPLYPYWNDTTRWPNGYSQLTDVGIKQAINAAKFIKERYNGFIPKDPKNAILRCTSIDRNWDTAELMGKVLWPVDEHRIDSMPPRIFTLPFPLDNLFYGPYCPYLSQQIADLAKYDEINTKYQFVYDFNAKHTGREKNLYNVAFQFEYIYQNNFNGYARDDWVTDYYYNLFEYLQIKSVDLWLSGLGLRLKIGLFLKELQDRMETVINPDCNADPWYKNFFLYEAHHFEVFTTLKALGHSPTQIVQYCSMVIFELHRINGGFVVKVFHINDTITPPFQGYQLKPSFCPEYDCPYETFISGIKQFIPNNWRDECGIPKDLDIYPMMDHWLTITNENIRPEGTIYTTVNNTIKNN